MKPNREPTYHEAVMALCPNAHFATSGDKAPITWHDMKGDSVPTEDQIQAKLTELKNTHTNTKYRRDRKPLYPDIGDQLDDLYKKGAFSDEMAAKLKKVKDDNPKP
tara:strand:+ start:534 stop:851 length:318 start_codon:yes stop_codon:yes gene_type:complete